MATSVVNATKDTWLDANAPTTNRNGLRLRIGDQGGSDGARTIAFFTMPANPGGGAVITEIKVQLYCFIEGGTSVMSVDVYRGTNTPAVGFVETEATWNVYSTLNNWTTAGGLSDFNSSIIDTYSVITADVGTYNPTWILLGAGATNPITATWGDTISLLFRAPSSAGKQYDFDRYTDSNPPIITVTYSNAVNSNFLAFM